MLELFHIELDPLIAWTRIKWDQIFQKKGPIKVEIGFGNGSFLVEMAQREPEANFIGLEVYRKGIRKAIKRIERAGIKNIRLIRLEAAASLPKLFTEGEISEVYINFPDPWPKRRHRKRRLINSSFVAMLYILLNDKGKVFIATDYQEYAQEIEKFFSSHGGFCSIKQYFPDHTPTKYEQEGIRKGLPIYYLGWEKLPLNILIHQGEGSSQRNASTALE